MGWLESLGLLGLFIGTFLAATIFPFSSDALYIAILAATDNPIGCLLVGTIGNWLGSVLTYWIGWLGRWEWLEKWFNVKRETLEKQKERIDKYGVWLALTAWIPFIGDVIAIALGFYKTRPGWTMVLLLVGKFARFLVWNLIYGLFQSLTYLCLASAIYISASFTYSSTPLYDFRLKLAQTVWNPEFRGDRTTGFGRFASTS